MAEEVRAEDVFASITDAISPVVIVPRIPFEEEGVVCTQELILQLRVFELLRQQVEHDVLLNRFPVRTKRKLVAKTLRLSWRGCGDDWRALDWRPDLRRLVGMFRCRPPTIVFSAVSEVKIDGAWTTRIEVREEEVLSL